MSDYAWAFWMALFSVWIVYGISRMLPSISISNQLDKGALIWQQMQK
jgi:hypothetical protein